MNVAEAGGDAGKGGISERSEGPSSCRVCPHRACFGNNVSAVSLIIVDSRLIRYFAAKMAFSAAKRLFGTEFAAKTAILAAKSAGRIAAEAVAGGNDEAGTRLSASQLGFVA